MQPALMRWFTWLYACSASGLGKSCVQDIVRAGGNAAVLDLNVSLGEAVVAELGADATRFFTCDVSDTASIAAAVAGVAGWVRDTGKPLGGIIPAAGVGRPGLILDRNLEPLALDAIDFVLSINLRGTLDLVRQALPLLARAP